MNRVRLVSATIVLNVVLDDGDTLTPIQVDPFEVAGGKWPEFDPVSVLADLQAQVDQSSTDDSHP